MRGSKEQVIAFRRIHAGASAIYEGVGLRRITMVRSTSTPTSTVGTMMTVYTSMFENSGHQACKGMRGRRDVRCCREQSPTRDWEPLRCFGCREARVSERQSYMTMVAPGGREGTRPCISKLDVSGLLEEWEPASLSGRDLRTAT